MLDAKRKAMIFLAAAFILAVLATALILNEMRNVQASLGETIEVAVADENIPTYTEINEEMISWEEVPASTEISSYVRESSELEGSISIVPVQQGDLMTKNILRSSVDVPDDHRVVWLNATNNVVMDQAVAEGDQVDIIVSYSSSNADQRTRRLFTSVDVVQRTESEEEEDIPASIKVSLPIDEAEDLIHYQNTADQIRVLLVNQVQTNPNEDPQAPSGNEEEASEGQEEANEDQDAANEEEEAVNETENEDGTNDEDSEQ
ncbi:Flp pilus assembly protein CpaB [Alteribacillus persepolensis]|uniref:Flp pilus assembly protein CpaB n=1 Tax=Alteribacillus persepolensis TaxID=568899 RepID=A0A1G8EY63_9BACI|nr:SAF domain-containing protein [Alteribacillus persepolensis]SDH74659.1 Flp pilus assembly protein CpaB [Alteribacillus persepolensis]